MPLDVLKPIRVYYSDSTGVPKGIQGTQGGGTAPLQSVSFCDLQALDYIVV